MQHSLDEESPSERELSSLLVTIREDDLPRLKERVREFRKELNLHFACDQSSKPDQLVLISTQLIQLTKKVEDTKNE